MTTKTRRTIGRALSAFILTGLVLAAGAALAQSLGDDAPVQGDFSSLGFIMGIVFGAIAAAIAVLAVVAPRTKNTADDTALAWLKLLYEKRDSIEGTVATVKDWADPTSANVPPSPSNPLGVDRDASSATPQS